jgi:hypothetical protein
LIDTYLKKDIERKQMRQMEIDLTRREALLAGMGTAVFGNIPFTVKPANAASSAALPANRIASLRAYGDILVPGASNAGITEFVSAMLASDDPLLFYKYLDFPLAPAAFYTSGLVALDDLSIRRKKRPYAGLGRDDMKAIAGALLDPDLDGWSGPPPFLFYLAVKNDAIDVVYGSVAAYDRLNIPYMPHILPPTTW